MRKHVDFTKSWGILKRRLKTKRNGEKIGGGRITKSESMTKNGHNKFWRMKQTLFGKGWEHFPDSEILRKEAGNLK